MITSRDRIRQAMGANPGATHFRVSRGDLQVLLQQADALALAAPLACDMFEDQRGVESPPVETGLVRLDSWKVVCQECRAEYEDWNGFTVWVDESGAAEAATDADWTVREGLVLCGDCGHRKVCMDEDRSCVRRDLTEADDGWMYCPDHIEQGMDA